MSRSKKPAKPGKLTQVLQDFVNAYVGMESPNGAGAYRLTHPGANAETARSAAKDILKNSLVMAEIERRLAKVAAKADVSKERVYRDLDRQQTGAETALQYGPAVKCTELLGKELGMFKERQVVEGSEGPLVFVIRSFKEENKTDDG